jgi:hypothetical protein
MQMSVPTSSLRDDWARLRKNATQYAERAKHDEFD